jgi:hypothetical protein
VIQVRQAQSGEEEANCVCEGFLHVEIPLRETTNRSAREGTKVAYD